MKSLFGLLVPVVPLSDLVRMKLTSFRPKDVAHLEILDESGLISASVEAALPAELQSYTIYSGAAHSQAPQPEEARALLKALRQPETAAVVKKSGMEPL